MNELPAVSAIPPPPPLPPGTNNVPPPLQPGSGPPQSIPAPPGSGAPPSPASKDQGERCQRGQDSIPSYCLKPTWVNPRPSLAVRLFRSRQKSLRSSSQPCSWSVFAQVWIGVDKAPRLTIRRVICILASDTEYLYLSTQPTYLQILRGQCCFDR